MLSQAAPVSHAAAGAYGGFSALEIVAGMPLGSCPLELPADPVPEPRAALSSLLRPALANPPCLIAFSGGRDSSALLAVAVEVARREGWAPPIPATLCFSSEATEETDWQQTVLRHLRLDDWIRLQISDELDMLGPVATRGLQRHGLLYPANAHIVVPMAEHAVGGHLLTGVGGDDVFGNWPWYDLAGVIAGRSRAHVRDVRRLLHLAAPASVRAEIKRRRQPLRLPWIVASQRGYVARRLAAELSSAPASWSARMLWSARWRPWRVTASSMEVLARDAGATLGSPFLDPVFLSSLAAAGGRYGWGNRRATMQALFGDLLPASVISRRSKAEFSEPLYATATKRFAEDWNGDAGPATDLVCPEVLRDIWRSPQPHGMSAMLLQASWIACNQLSPDQ
jgi:asparagine synthetase B (glutamine-hydrolysing)